MSDQFNVTAVWDKTTYSAGDIITGTITGGDVETVTTQSTIGPVIVPLVAADGAKSTITIPAVPVTVTTVSAKSVVIDKTVPIIDNGPSPRTWTVSASGLSISATA